MKRPNLFFCLVVAMLHCLWVYGARAQQVGSISGTVLDEDFDRVLPGARVLIAETEQAAETDEQGGFVIGEVEPGVYTLIVSKEGYTRSVRNQVQVTAGQVASVEVGLSGEFTELDPVVVRDLKLDAGTEAQLLELRQDAAGLLDSIGSDLISKSGAGDAAAALSLVSGATVQDNKAVIRGLPDRFVSSQLNGVRLPSSDAKTRAIDLDQFPSDVIESIQVSKTFTPDQQGDASGGAVNIVTKSIPDRNIFKISTKVGTNTNVVASNDFLTYRGADIPTFGRDDSRADRIDDFTSLAGISTGTKEVSGPVDYSFDMTLGGRTSTGDGWVVGGIATVFYSQSFDQIEDGVDDDWEVTSPGNIEPDESTGGGNRLSSLFDVRESSEERQLGGLFTAGIENDSHKLGVTYFGSLTSTDTATLLEDTRGKFNPINPDPTEPTNFPFRRSETLALEERSIQSLQFRGEHTLNLFDRLGGDGFAFLPPQLDWTASLSNAKTTEPDRRQLGSVWFPATAGIEFPPGSGFILPGSQQPAEHVGIPASTGLNFGSFQRIFEEVEEDSEQLSLNVTLPFEQWNEREGFIKFGIFEDRVERAFDQENFSNDRTQGGQNGASEGEFDEFLSTAIDNGTATQGLGTISASDTDVDYEGEFDISAWYLMTDLPLTSWLSVIGGVRFEKTDISIQADPELDAPIWTPATGAVGAFSVPATMTRAIDPVSGLPLGDAVFQQDDVLPAIALRITPVESLIIRLSYTETIARQTFRELSPVRQEEFLGGDAFIGNPNLKPAAIENYDFRVDYTPRAGTFLSMSLFRKDITDPIEFVSRTAAFVGDFTTALNSPEGRLQGVELEARQDLGELWEDLTGLSAGFNATLIDSEVTLSDFELGELNGLPSFPDFPTTRQMVNAPDYLVNFNLTYDNDETGTQVGMFYTLKGETLVRGLGTSGTETFTPSVFAQPFDQLNVTLTQRLSDHFNIKLSLKNLTNPLIEEVFKSEFAPDRVRRAERRGIDISLSIGGEFEF